jgi:hypothetical protein
MNFKKRFTALALSAVMAVSQMMPVMAEAPSSTEADGNILAFDNETVVVPTAIELSFNPDQYEVTVRGTDTVTDQIVTLNYGVASEATKTKIVNVSLEANIPETVEGKKAIEFVDSQDAVDEATPDDLKLYLALATNDDSGVPTKQDDTAFGVTNGTSTADADGLSDVKMAVATKGRVAFAVNEEKGKVSANVAVSLNKAAYQKKAGETIDFDTIQGDDPTNGLATKLELKTLGGVAGFTFVGAMNANGDWTTANTAALKITPIYEVKTALGDEVLIEGTKSQVASESAPSVSGTSFKYTSGKALEIPASLGAGSLAATGVDRITYTNSSGVATSLAATNWSYANGKITFTESYITSLAGNNVTRDYKITFKDAANTQIVINIHP